MSTISDWLSLLLGINTVQNGGVTVPNSPGRFILNFIGAVVADNPSNNSTDITFPTASAVPVPSVAMSANTTLTSPAVNATYSVNTTTSSITVTIAGVPVDGVELTFVDESQMWPTHRFGFQCQAAATTRNPENVAGADTSGAVSVGNVAGESFTLKWFQGVSKWLPV